MYNVWQLLAAALIVLAGCLCRFLDSYVWIVFLILCMNNRFWNDMLGLILCRLWIGVGKFMDWYAAEWTTAVWTVLWGWLVQTLGLF